MRWDLYEIEDPQGKIATVEGENDSELLHAVLEFGGWFMFEPDGEETEDE